MGAGADPGEDVQVDRPGVQLVFEEYEEFFHRARDPVGFADHEGVAGLDPSRDAGISDPDGVVVDVVVG
ncbi:hypothetical protein OHA10_37075 [Kribbella sp. NBC_00662]